MYKGHEVEGSVDEIKALLKMYIKRGNYKKHKRGMTAIQKKRISEGIKKSWKKRLQKSNRMVKQK